METLQVSYSLHKGDYILAHFHHFFKQRWYWVLTACLCIFFILITKDPVLSVLSILLFIAVQCVYRYYRVKKALKDINNAETIDLIIDAFGITIKTGARIPVIISFAEINNVAETRKFHYIITNQNRILIIPKLPTKEQQLTKILERIEAQRIKRPHTGFSQFGKQSVIKPVPYWVGLFCLLPGIGGFLGAIWLFLGVKFRDRWLILIGVGGIVFTACFLLFTPDLKHLDFAESTYVDISQQELNKIVYSLETYKIRNGEYPRLLEDLGYYAGRKAPITDVIHMGKTGRYPYYYYSRVADQYVLYSSGLDGIPNTNDDLHPKLSRNELKKTGLLLQDR